MHDDTLASQPTEAHQRKDGFTSTCPQTEVNDHPASLSITSG